MKTSSGTRARMPADGLQGLNEGESMPHTQRDVPDAVGQIDIFPSFQFQEWIVHRRTVLCRETAAGLIRLHEVASTINIEGGDAGIRKLARLDEHNDIATLASRLAEALLKGVRGMKWEILYKSLEE